MQTANHIGADPDTITVRVPIALRRRGRRKTLIASGGSPMIAASHARNDTALVRAIARAFRWRKLIETGVYATVAEIAAAEGINPSYASRVLRLTLLAPDLVASVLDGAHTDRLDRLLRPLPVEWPVQRTELSCIEKPR